MYPNYWQQNKPMTPNIQINAPPNVQNNQQYLQPTYNTHPNQPNFYQSPQSTQEQISKPTKFMYSSSIQPPTLTQPSKVGGFGLGKLESMGRFIKEEPETGPSKVQEAPVVSTQQPPLTFKASRSKMSSSVIFQKSSEDDLNRFPIFGIQDQKAQNPTFTNNNFQNKTSFNFSQTFSTSENITKDEAISTNETPEEKKRKQIIAIKEQLESLSKKMQRKNLNNATSSIKSSALTNDTQEQKPYFQLLNKNGQNNNTNTLNLQSENSSKTFFQKYAAGTESKNQPNKISINADSSNTYQSNSLKNYNPKTTTLASTNFSNPINNYQSPKGDSEPTVFKKKKQNPYIAQDSNIGNEYQQKLTLLSPKNNVNPPLFKAEKKVEIVQHIKPIETKTVWSEPKQVESIGSKPIKGIRKIDSFNENQQKLIEFKKSDFKIGKKMGKGQFGQVMLVQHKQTGFICGMKVMSKKQIRDQKYENQIARELSIQFFLSHRNIAPLYGYFCDEENVYLLVEFCTGGQLLEMLRKNHRMEESEVSPIIRQICEGIDYIHKESIIHRDIKPQNILFNFGAVKISDFGWAVHNGNGMRKTISGSPLYYSPEVVLQTEYDEKIDIWAIGMMTYQCILGKIPFRIYSELDLNRIVQDEIKFPEYVDVTDEAKDFILRIMRKKPEQRMQIRQMMRHPFITKHNQRKISSQILEEFRKCIG